MISPARSARKRVLPSVRESEEDEENNVSDQEQEIDQERETEERVGKEEEELEEEREGEQMGNSSIQEVEGVLIGSGEMEEELEEVGEEEEEEEEEDGDMTFLRDLATGARARSANSTFLPSQPSSKMATPIIPASQSRGSQWPVPPARNPSTDVESDFPLANTRARATRERTLQEQRNRPYAPPLDTGAERVVRRLNRLQA